MNDYEKLEKLLREKPYEELSDSDLSFVDSLMTASEYKAQQELLQHFNQAIPLAPMPPAHLSENLRSTVLANKKTGFTALHYWSVAAAFLGVFFLGRWSNIPDAILPPPVKTITLLQTEKHIDTLFLDRVEEKLIPKYIYRETIIHDTIYIQAFADKGLLPDTLYKESSSPTIVSEIEKSQNAKKTSRLLEMIVDVY